MKLLRALAFALPVLAGIGLVWWSVSNRPSPIMVEPEERRVPAAYVLATPRVFTPEVSGFGSVRPAQVWNAVAQVAGRIEEVHPNFVRGGFIASGETILRIASEDYELAVARAEADIRSAEARIEEMRLSGRTTQASLDIETQALSLAERDLARIAELAERGAVSSAVVEDQQRDVLAQQVKVTNLQNALVLLPAQVEALAQSAEVYRAAKRAAELDLERTVLTAPFDGRVAAADVEVSQYVGVGAVMGALDGVASAEIDVQIPPRRMAALARLAFQDRQGVSAASSPFADRLSARASLGMEVDEPAPEWPATVARISDAVDPETRSIGVIVRIADPYVSAAPGARPPLIKGMFVKATLSGPNVEGSVLVPRAAVRDGRVMLADADDRLRFAAVTTVFAWDGIVALAPDALPDGARVVVSEPSPAIEGLLLAPERDDEVEARLDATATDASVSGATR